jgi:hypothetical protein
MWDKRPADNVLKDVTRLLAGVFKHFRLKTPDKRGVLDPHSLVSQRFVADVV